MPGPGPTFYHVQSQPTLRARYYQNVQFEKNKMGSEEKYLGPGHTAGKR